MHKALSIHSLYNRNQTILYNFVKFLKYGPHEDEDPISDVNDNISSAWPLRGI
jgi:hypothetical protein